jgi:hypothetical protein
MGTMIPLLHMDTVADKQVDISGTQIFWGKLQGFA